MAEDTPREKLQPFLLDRLTDDEPEKKQESRLNRIMSERKLREVVLRDLGWLLNTSRLEATEDLGEYEEVRNSVLNYGIPDLAGQMASQLDPAMLVRLLKESIVTFEPRINKRTVKVRAYVTEDHSHRALAFEIEGQLWAYPAPQHLLMRTEVDLETGDVKVRESSGRKES